MCVYGEPDSTCPRVVCTALHEPFVQHFAKFLGFMVSREIVKRLFHLKVALLQVCMYACLYLYLCVCVCLYGNWQVLFSFESSSATGVYVCMCMCVCVCDPGFLGLNIAFVWIHWLYIYIHIYTDTYTHTRTYAHTYARTSNIYMHRHENARINTWASPKLNDNKAAWYGASYEWGLIVHIVNIYTHIYIHTNANNT